VASGIIEVIQVAPSYGPPLNNLRRTLGDDAVRRRWWSQQNIDYSFLVHYSHAKSKYDLQLEDDVTTISGYLDTIRDLFYMQISNEWVTLEFSTLGFIGKLFKTDHVKHLR
jgi:hypothetical protein